MHKVCLYPDLQVHPVQSLHLAVYLLLSLLVMSLLVVNLPVELLAMYLVLCLASVPLLVVSLLVELLVVVNLSLVDLLV